MATYIISDLKLFDEEQRKSMGFYSIEEMNRGIIKSWNKIIDVDDKVIIMGDHGSGSPEQMKSVIEQLNGELCSLGRFDNFSRIELYRMGFNYVWQANMYKDTEFGTIIYAACPLSNLDYYKKTYKLVVVGANNSVEGIVEDNLISIEASKWYYSPINTEKLLEVYENLKVFNNMKETETRTDVEEGN